MAQRGLRVVGLVDLHWSGRSPLRLPDLDGADLVLLGGDLTHFRGVEVARAMIEEIRSRGVEVLAVCGNCDRPEIEDYLRREAIDLDRRARRVGDVVIAGISAGLPFGGTPYERTEEDFAAAAEEALLAAAVEAREGDRAPVASSSRLSSPPAAGSGATGALPVLLVSHQPPLGTHCDSTRGRHVGSSAIRDAILRHQPDLVLCGHIHEAAGGDLLGGSRIVNPGPWFQGGVLRLTAGDGRIEID